jgi:radical S-adenosyl methionine domain-containing protein 2
MTSNTLATQETSTDESELSVRSVNWHVWPSCNYNCIFCFAKFESENERSSTLELDKGLNLLSQLVEAGMEKITFVGGEPMLCPHLGEYIEYAKEFGCLTMIVSNGSLIREKFLERYCDSLDWVGISMDSSIESTERNLGRGYGNHLTNLIKVAEIAHKYDIRLKVNVTVTRRILQEDLHQILQWIQPDRLKFLQVLHVRGENDGVFEELAVSKGEFYEFVYRHRDLTPVVEDNEMMRGSYAMIDPAGRFFQNTHGTYKYSSPIHEIGVLEALRQVGFSWKKLVERGGSEYFASMISSRTSIDYEAVEGF